MREALFWESLPESAVRCHLCRLECIIPKGGRGRCRTRENYDGRLVSLVYGQLIAAHVDPVEKKPLFHVLPGSRCYSVATLGCNFRCRHCQNDSISQPKAELIGQERPVPPERVAQAALVSGCAAMAFTYTEPTVFYEYALDIARLSHENGLKNLFVTNGYMQKGALTQIAPLMDAANVDLKAFSEAFYRDIVGARLSEMLDSLRCFRELGIWLEITTLLIPGLNDTDQELRDLARFIVTDLGKDVPWHVTAFHPAYALRNCPPTPPGTLLRARAIGRAEGLRHVYSGNIPGAGGESTVCPSCGKTVIERRGFSLQALHLTKGSCDFCGAALAGIWE